MTAEAESFTDFFTRATGHPPYVYQRALGELPQPPAVLAVPTGAGKTQALIVSWLYARRIREAGPRRLVYALPMRSLVEQTAEVACHIREHLGLTDDELPIHTLMGGVEAAELRAWCEFPTRDQILVGTIDMLLSRALNRGYAESRFAWPISFGLLNNDCRWVFDEVQLMGPARATSAQLDGLRAAFGTALPCETIWASATVDRSALRTIDHPELGDAMSLPEQDRSGALRDRLHARKTLLRSDVSQLTDRALATHIAQTAVEHHLPGTRTLVVLNTVDLAQSAYRELVRLAPAETVLLHSRFRPPERTAHMQLALEAPGATGTIVVATQVVEAGVDMSARTLITETAPFSSIVQRLGRCNRAGEHDASTVVWLDRGPLPDGAAGRKAAAPYTPVDIELARDELLKLEDTSLSPAALDALDVKETADDPAVLRRRDLLDLFDTSPDLSGTDIDIAPFIREDDDRSVTVLFRDLPDDTPAHIPGQLGTGHDGQPGPGHDELVQVPRGSLGRRACWALDHVAGGWTRRDGRDLAPGATALLRAADGGYDTELGWDGKAKQAVEPIQPKPKDEAPGIGDDPASAAKVAEELLPHLEQVAAEAERLTDALGLAQWRDTLSCAGALHDIGKAHPVFQRTLRAAIFADAGERDDGRLWAKSGTLDGHAREHDAAQPQTQAAGEGGGQHRGRGHERRHFRHELASALAIWRPDGPLRISQRALVAYLVGAHHGKVRLSIRPAPDEQRPSDSAPGARFALGVADGDELPVVVTPLGAVPASVLDLAPMELGAENSWTAAAARLRDDPALGPFRLAFLEALLRISDWRASDA